MSKPSKKWVLVRYRDSEPMYLIEREAWEVYAYQAKVMGVPPSEWIAESDSMEELKRFRALTEEG